MWMRTFARMNQQQRVICRYDEGRKGPLLICLGGIHGNEPAGVQAIKTVGTLLHHERSMNPGFEFSGRMLGLAGNVQALEKSKRFISMDMNRAFTGERIAHVFEADVDTLTAEDLELRQLIAVIRDEIREYQPERIVLLDIHSTSATGGIFVIASEDPESARIGVELHAPVILNFAKEVTGTTLGFFGKQNFDTEIVTVVFESGQHNEPLSVNRAIAAIINCMRTIGCVSPEAVENKHDKLLQEYSQGLPKVAKLIERYGIQGREPFRMARPFANFAKVTAGEVVAYEGEHPVRAIHNGLILLPRLQDQGDDGFFVVAPVSE